MNNELNNNNSKKLIIGISIMFCTVILIIGGTFAFFTQSDTKEIGNIVSSNDNNAYINYIEEKNMMFDNLIPMKSEDIEKALYRSNTCVDDNGYNVCSIYMFSLENTYGEVQKINISMIPTANSFTNLKYMVAKMGTDGLPNIITDEPLPLEKNNLNQITLIENELLYSGQENMGTYAILFYIESKGYDQTKEDAGKSFGASIRVDSVTTGNYLVKSFGDSCWDLEYVGGKNDGYKLTKFKGIDNTFVFDSELGKYVLSPNSGSVKEECKDIYVTKDETDGYYTINIPSSVGGYNITTLGKELFLADELKEVNGQMKESFNNYVFIKKINISEGITTIENGAFGDELKGTFIGVGQVNWIKTDKENINVDIKLPSTLEYIGIGCFAVSSFNNISLPNNVKYIGGSSFFGSNLIEINIPSSVEYIGKDAFRLSKNLKKVIFNVNSDGTSNLRTIDDYAFHNCDLEYNSEDNPLIIPKSVSYVGIYPFALNDNLKFIKYTGDNLSDFNKQWNHNATIIYS